jgi:hypothetical protein
MTFPVFASGDVLNASDMNAVGTWLVDSHTFTTVSSVTRSNVYTSNYTNYMHTLTLTAVPTQGILTIQFTVGGTATTTNYVSRTARWYAASLGWELTDNESGTDEIGILVVSQTNPDRAAGFFYVFKPQAANSTNVVTHNAGAFSGNQYWESVAGWQTASTQFDGFKLNFAGNYSGTIRTYGLRG